jgi:protein-L-isoaspartate(D-aspartate) O-methyltransferase
MSIARRHCSLVVAGVIAITVSATVLAQDPLADARAALVREIEANVRANRGITGMRRLKRSTLRAIGTVPRHEFVPATLESVAYLNRPLPIGQDQTISQPYIVALMTDLADVNERSVVLEIGTGSGYQAAVLAEIVDEVFTIEIVETLGRRAAATLERLGYGNVHTRIGDGYAGWPERAPFDAIVVTAAPDAVPQPLIEQLAVGGRLVVPVGPPDRTQSLQVLEKRPDGTIETTQVLPVLFVPFTRDPR